MRSGGVGSRRRRWPNAQPWMGGLTKLWSTSEWVTESGSAPVRFGDGAPLTPEHLTRTEIFEEVGHRDTSCSWVQFHHTAPTSRARMVVETVGVASSEQGDHPTVRAPPQTNPPSP